MSLAPLIQDLAVMLAVAGLITLIFRKIRQPVVLGYLIAGVLLGPHALSRPLITDYDGIHTWGQLGVIFVMFSLGLEFSFRKLAKAGGATALAACLEVAAVAALGFGVGRLFGFSPRDSAFLGAMISISSTTLIIRSLKDRDVETMRFTRVVFSMLVVEDLLAVLWVVALSTFSWKGDVSGMELVASLGKLLLVVTGWFVAGYLVLPRFLRKVRHWLNDEMLTIVSLALCLSLAVIAVRLQYSVALGAFIMGSILAESREAEKIEELVRPLRDLFAAVFFVSVGMLLDPSVLVERTLEVVALALLVIVGKFAAVSMASLSTGQTIPTSLQAASSMTQIGEFSFIIASLGIAAGALSPDLYPEVIAVSILTAFATPYLIRLFVAHSVRFEALFPERFRRRHLSYLNWLREKKGDRERRAAVIPLFKAGLNAAIVGVIFHVIDQDFGAHDMLGWCVALLISAPFILGMFRASAAPLSRLLCLAWLGLVSSWILPARPVFLVIAAVGLALLLFFRRELERSYVWFERQFLSSFRKERAVSEEQKVKQLLPWDAHLVRIQVHPNSAVMGRSLRELDLKHHYGLNVVAIRRGSVSMVPPGPGDRLLPFDELLVLGSDEQVAEVRAAAEKPVATGVDRELSAYHLRSIRVGERSPLEGRTIRESSLREKQGAMVVGIERGNHRILNPESDTLLKKGDLLWIVGER